ncbi:MAG TPA: GNAT family protein [Thermomicrobiales bacterium]|jgi:aminoglycoside 6'-N-acetyltransferase
MTTANTETISGERVLLRTPVDTDVPRLAEILADPAVAGWWGHWDRDRVRREIVHRGDETVPFAIELDGRVIGYIQYSEDNDPDYRRAGIDLFLHPAWHGRGLGADALRTLARYLFDVRGHHRLTIDPAADNHRAIRSYRRVGFRPVGIMRRYERGPDGTWHDGLLMDMLREDLT